MKRIDDRLPILPGWTQSTSHGGVEFNPSANDAATRRKRKRECTYHRGRGGSRSFDACTSTAGAWMWVLDVGSDMVDMDLVGGDKRRGKSVLRHAVSRFYRVSIAHPRLLPFGPCLPVLVPRPRICSRSHSLPRACSLLHARSLALTH